jgi:hypothetical protein
MQAGPGHRKRQFQEESESFDIEQHPWSLIGIVPQGDPDRHLSRAIERQLSCSNHLATHQAASR